MDFELTISGLCLIVLNSQDDRPKNPDKIEVLCVGASEHRPRMSYLPAEVHPISVEPSLVVDPLGVQSASLDIAGKSLALDFGTNPTEGFSLKWAEQNGNGNAPLDESLMDWVPTAAELGFDELNVGDPGTIPPGVLARLSLPPGKLMSRKVVRNPVSGSYFVWEFPAKPGLERALANEVVYRAEEVEDLNLTASDGTVLLEADKSSGTLYMSISNDLNLVHSNFRLGVDTLDHLSDLQNLAASPNTFGPPRIARVTQRTGHPICNQVLYLNRASVS